MTIFVDSGERTESPAKIGGLAKFKALILGVNVPKPRNASDPASIGRSFSTVNLAVGGDSVELWVIPIYEPLGTVVLFHGYAGSKSDLLNVAKVFSDRLYDVILVDFPGSGGSSGYVTTLGVREAEVVGVVAKYARDRASGKQVTGGPEIPPSLQDMSLTTGPLILFGPSMGGAAVLRAAAADPLIADGLILESVFDSLLHATQNRFEAMNLPSFPAAELIVFWGGIQHDFSGFAHNPSRYAHAVRIPTLLIHAGGDRFVTESESRSIFENLAGAKSFVTIPNAPHGTAQARDPELWNTAVVKFLAEVTTNN